MSASKHLSLLTWSQTTLERRVSLFFHSIFLVWLGYKWSKATNQCNSSLVNTSFSGSRLCHGFSSRQEFSAVYPRVFFPYDKNDSYCLCVGSDWCIYIHSTPGCRVYISGCCHWDRGVIVASLILFGIKDGFSFWSWAVPTRGYWFIRKLVFGWQWLTGWEWVYVMASVRPLRNGTQDLCF